MGQGYTRADVSNNIANTNVADADDLDAEFDLLEDSFAAGTGHSHDGTTAEGGPITVVGPNQDLVITNTEAYPKTNNTLDLGKTDRRIKNLYLHGSIIANDGTTSATITHDDLINTKYAPITPQQFGAVGDGTTDDTTAMQAWATELRTNGGAGYLPQGTYLCTDQIYFYPEADFIIFGAGRRVASIKFNISDRTKAGLKFSNTDNTTRSSYIYSLSEFMIEAASTNKACLLEHLKASSFSYRDLRIRAYCGVTAIRVSDVFNAYMENLWIYGAGHNVAYKDVPEGSTFSISSGGTTLTASTATFAAGDVGKNITLMENAGLTKDDQRFTISSYTNTTTVTVSTTAKTNLTSLPASFGGVRGSISSSGTTLTLESDVLSSDDIGRTVYVLGAGTLANSSVNEPLRATITAVSGTSITLDTAATATVSNAELVFDPAVEIVSSGTNDFHATNIHIEDHRGCGLVAQGIRMFMNGLKCHSVGEGVNEEATNIQVLLANYYGYIQGDFEQSVCGNTGRIVVTSCFGGNAPTFGYIESSGYAGYPIIRVQGCSNNAIITLSDIRPAGGNFTGLESEQITTDGTGYIRQYGATANRRTGTFQRDYTTLPPTLLTDADDATTEGLFILASGASNIPVAEAGLLTCSYISSTILIHTYLTSAGKKYHRIVTSGTPGSWTPLSIDMRGLSTYTTYGGTANAITLTSGYSIPSLVTGMEVRFRASNANTTTTTINLDGLGTVTCKTVTGVDLPSGYIRTDVDTITRYNGTNWIVYRSIEQGSNANGTYVKFEDGTMIADHSFTFANVSSSGFGLYTSGATSWTFPTSFSAAPNVTVSADVSYVWGGTGAASTNSVSIRLLTATNTVTGTTTALVNAKGNWY